MKSLDAICCATCIFWERTGPALSTAVKTIDANPEIGVCAARAPSVYVQAGVPVSIWPQTHESRACGDWMGDEDDGPGDGESEAAPVDATVVHAGQRFKARPRSIHDRLAPAAGRFGR